MGVFLLQTISILVHAAVVKQMPLMQAFPHFP